MQLEFLPSEKKNLIHSLCILVTKFNSSAIIPAIIHIQNMLLTGQAWTERCSAGFSVSVESHSEQQAVILVDRSWVYGSKVNGLSGGLVLWRSCSS